MDLSNKFKKGEKVKVRVGIPESIVDSWIEGVFCFCNESDSNRIEYAVYFPKLKYTIFVSPEQVSKLEE